MPPSPSTGSSRQPATALPVKAAAANAASSAAISLGGTCVKLSSAGSNGARNTALDVPDSAPMVLPWNAPNSAMKCRRPVASIANLSECSTLSAPDDVKKA